MDVCVKIIASQTWDISCMHNLWLIGFVFNIRVWQTGKNSRILSYMTSTGTFYIFLMLLLLLWLYVR